MAQVLIDTSAWIEFFRPDGDGRYRTAVSQLLDDNDASFCGMIQAEILRGARSDREYRALADRLTALHYLPTAESIWSTMGSLGSQLLRKGVQVPSTDLLIATMAMQHRMPLLHKDRHFTLIAKHTALRLFPLTSTD